MKIGIYGAGAFGTALSFCIQEGCYLFFKFLDQFQDTLKTKENPYLPGHKLLDRVVPTMDLKLLKNLELLFLAVPVQQTTSAVLEIAPYLSKETALIIASKGIVCDEIVTRDSFLDKKISKIVPNKILVMSGPNFASEIAKGYKMATTLACSDEKLAIQISKRISSKNSKFYVTNDVTGVIVSGAIKNVYAIASGILIGKDLGKNAHSALIARALAEMRRLGIALGARLDTFLGLSSVGDLVLTCSHMDSRNMRLGYALAKDSHKFDELAEGVFTAKAVYHLANNLGIYLPIAFSVYDILHNNKSVDSLALFEEQDDFFEEY